MVAGSRRSAPAFPAREIVGSDSRRPIYSPLETAFAPSGSANSRTSRRTGRGRRRRGSWRFRQRRGSGSRRSLGRRRSSATIAKMRAHLSDAVLLRGSLNLEKPAGPLTLLITTLATLLPVRNPECLVRPSVGRRRNSRPADFGECSRAGLCAFAAVGGRRRQLDQLGRGGGVERRPAQRLARREAWRGQRRCAHGTAGAKRCAPSCRRARRSSALSQATRAGRGATRRSLAAAHGSGGRTST